MTKGFSQVAVIDFNETASPTSASAAIKMIASIANEIGLPIYHLDVSQVFVQASVKGEFLMRLAPGCGEISGKIVKLLRCQYGFKQAGTQYHLLLGKLLVDVMGLEQC